MFFFFQKANSILCKIHFIKDPYFKFVDNMDNFAWFTVRFLSIFWKMQFKKKNHFNH